MIVPAPLSMRPLDASPAAVAAALFDWDGTVSNSRRVLLEAWHRSTELVLGRRFPEGPLEENDVFTRPGAEIWAEIARDRHEAARLAGAFQDAYGEISHALRPFSGIPEVLARLRDAGVAVGIVTSKARERLIADAACLGIQRLIDVAVCAGEAAAAKPDPAPVLAALELVGIDPSRSAVVGDTVVDVTAGRAAGALAIGVAWGHGDRAELVNAGAAAVADEPWELIGLLLGPGSGSRPGSPGQHRE